MEMIAEYFMIILSDRNVRFIFVVSIVHDSEII